MIDREDLEAELRTLAASAQRPGRGVGQSDVDRAADAILTQGERPTIDKVRRLLGTGSPNTVTPLLDNWYRRLGSRLKDNSAGATSTGAPPEVVEAMSRLWTSACALARQQVEQNFTSKRDELDSARSELDAERARLQEEAKALTASRTSLEDAIRLAHGQIGELRRELEERSSQIVQEQGRARELQEALEAARAALTEAHVRAQQQLAEQAKQHAQEREREADRASATHRHHLQELDRARQETLSAKRELQGASETIRELEVRLDTARHREEQLREEISSREMQLAELRLESQAAKDGAAAAQQVAEINANRATELSEQLTAAREREDDLRNQLREGKRRQGTSRTRT